MERKTATDVEIGSSKHTTRTYRDVLEKAISSRQSAAHHGRVGLFTKKVPTRRWFHFMPGEIPPGATWGGDSGSRPTEAGYLSDLIRMDCLRATQPHLGYNPHAFMWNSTEFDMDARKMCLPQEEELNYTPPLALAWRLGPTCHHYQGVKFREVSWLAHVFDRTTDEQVCQQKDSELLAAPYITVDCGNTEKLGCHCNREFTFTKEAYLSHPVTSAMRRLDNQTAVRHELACMMRGSAKNNDGKIEYLSRMLDPENPDLRYITLPFGTTSDPADKKIILMQVPVCRSTFQGLFKLTADYDARLMKKRKQMGSDHVWKSDAEIFRSAYCSKSDEAQTFEEDWWTLNPVCLSTASGKNKKVDVSGLGGSFPAEMASAALLTVDDIFGLGCCVVPTKGVGNVGRKTGRCRGGHPQRKKRRRSQPPLVYEKKIYFLEEEYIAWVDFDYLARWIIGSVSVEESDYGVTEFGERVNMRFWSESDRSRFVMSQEGTLGYSRVANPSSYGRDETVWLGQIIKSLPEKKDLMARMHRAGAISRNRNTWSLDFDSEYQEYKERHDTDHYTKLDDQCYKKDASFAGYLERTKTKGLRQGFIDEFGHPPTSDKNKWSLNGVDEYLAYCVATARPERGEQWAWLRRILKNLPKRKELLLTENERVGPIENDRNHWSLDFDSEYLEYQRTHEVAHHTTLDSMKYKTDVSLEGFLRRSRTEGLRQGFKEEFGHGPTPDRNQWSRRGMDEYLANWVVAAAEAAIPAELRVWEFERCPPSPTGAGAAIMLESGVTGGQEITPNKQQKHTRPEPSVHPFSSRESDTPCDQVDFETPSTQEGGGRFHSGTQNTKRSMEVDTCSLTRSSPEQKRTLFSPDTPQTRDRDQDPCDKVVPETPSTQESEDQFVPRTQEKPKFVKIGLGSLKRNGFLQKSAGGVISNRTGGSSKRTTCEQNLTGGGGIFICQEMTRRETIVQQQPPNEIRLEGIGAIRRKLNF